MKKTFTGLFLCLLIMFMTSEGSADDIVRSRGFRVETDVYGQNEIYMDDAYVGMPLGRILMIRKDKEYCALKFTRFWTEKNDREGYATYEVYYKNDDTNDFLNKDVKYSEGKASILPPTGPIRPFLKQPGYPKVNCGPFRLHWGYGGRVAFFDNDEKELGIELAPTPWTSVSEINLNDPRLKWYSYDGKRRIIRIPVDQLWSAAGQKKINN